MTEPLDLGDGHTLRFSMWSPDRELNPQYEGVPDIPRVGATVYHPTPAGETCSSGVYFDLPEVRERFPQLTDENVWQVVSWDPLTLSPSLLCMRCGDHGFIRGGKWVRA